MDHAYQRRRPRTWRCLLYTSVIGDYVTEVNVTSPTCFVEIAEQTGFDVAGMFVQALEKAVAAGAAVPAAA